MRIVLTSEVFLPRTSGLVRSVRLLAESLHQDGHAVSLVCPDTQAAREWAMDTGINLIPARSFWRRGDIALGTLNKAPLLLPSCDVVHLHSPGLIGVSVAKLARARHRPIVSTLHTLPGNVTGPLPIAASNVPGIDALILRAIIWPMRRADVLTAPSEFGAQLLRPYATGRPVCVVSNGLPGSAEMPTRTSTGSITRRLRLLYVGRLQREKRVPELLRAVAACHDLGLPVALTVAGDGPDAPRLMRHAERTGHVTFTGRVSDAALRDLYLAADVFCMASRNELQCCAALEAMGHGLPVIAARAGALPETIPDGLAGHLYQPGNMADFAAKLRAMVVTDQYYTALSAAALAHATSHDMTHTTARLLDIYSSPVATS